MICSYACRNEWFCFHFWSTHFRLLSFCYLIADEILPFLFFFCCSSAVSFTLFCWFISFDCCALSCLTLGGCGLVLDRMLCFWVMLQVEKIDSTSVDCVMWSRCSWYAALCSFAFLILLSLLLSQLACCLMFVLHSLMFLLFRCMLFLLTVELFPFLCYCCCCCCCCCHQFVL